MSGVWSRTLEARYPDGMPQHAAIMKLNVFILLVLAAFRQRGNAESRPWCLDGVGLCRGAQPASAVYSHTLTLVPGAGVARPKAYLLGGQRSTATSSFVSLNTVSFIDFQDMTLVTTEKVMFDTGNASRPQRSGHSAVPYNGSVLLFGGSVVNRTESKSPVATNEVLWLDLGDAFSPPLWRVLFNRTRDGGAGGSSASSNSSQQAPAPRQNAAAAISGDRLWVFGGVDNNTQILDDTWSFNITGRTWTRHLPSVRGSVPRDANGTRGLQRAAMIATPDGRYLVLYGGRTQGMSATSIDPNPQNGLWVFDVASGNWRKVDMGVSDEANPAPNDAALVLLSLADRSDVGTNPAAAAQSSELGVISTGFWKPANDSKSTTYKMWVQAKISNTSGGSFLAALPALFNGSNPSAQLPFIPQLLFISSKTSTVLQTNANSTVLDISASYGRPSFPDRITPVKDSALALYFTPNQHLLYISGGQDVTGMASSKLLIVDLDWGDVIDTSAKLKPGAPSRDSTKVFRYGVHSVALRAPSEALTDGNMTDLLFFTGADNLDDDDEPVLSEFVVLDAGTQQVTSRCSSSNQAKSTCKVLPVPRDMTTVYDIPGPRDGMSYTSIYQVFKWNDGDQEVDVGGQMVLMYGGMQLVGNSLNNTAAKTAGEQLTPAQEHLRDIVATCDAQGSLDSTELDALAQCGMEHLTQDGGRSVGLGCDTGYYYYYYYDYSNGYDDYAYSPPPASEDVWCGCFPLSQGPDGAPPPYEMIPQQQQISSLPDPPAAPAEPPPPARRGSLLEAGAGADAAARPKMVRGGGTQRQRDHQGWRGRRHGRQLVAGASAASAWGNRAAAAAAAAGKSQSRSWKTAAEAAAAAAKAEARSTKSAAGVLDASAPTVFGTAYAALWVSPDAANGSYDSGSALVDQKRQYYSPGNGIPSAVLGGPAFYFDPLVNVNGSELHAPGERAAATLVNLPYEGKTNTDAILFGGLTAVNKSAENDMLGVPVVTNDIYYLQYIPAAPGGYPNDSSLPAARFPSCPFAAGGDGSPACTSVAVFPQADGGGSTRGPRPPSPPLKQDSYVPLYKDCPDPLRNLTAGAKGTYQLRLFKSTDKKRARSMSIIFLNWDKGLDITPYIAGRSLAAGPCCAGNSSRWAWPPDVPEALNPIPPDILEGQYTSDSLTGESYWIYLPNEVYDVYLISGGDSWTSHDDMNPPLNCSAASPERCPRIELYNVEANRTILGLGGFGVHTTWLSASTNGDNYYLFHIRLAICADPSSSTAEANASPAAPPDGSNGSTTRVAINKYPFMVEGQPNLLRSHELQLAPGHDTDPASMPQGRMWHASCFVETKDLPATLGFGRLGLLAVHGGVTNHKMDSIDIVTEFLDDLWVFDLEYRKWTLMTGGGNSPGQRLRHNMKADGSVIYLTGGYTYDADTQTWPYDTKVYYIDVQLGIDAVWTQIDGDDTVIGRRTSPTAITQGMGVSRRRSQLITMNDQGIVFVPKPISETLDAPSSEGSGGGTTSAVTGQMLEVVIDKMYDGDLLLLPEDKDLSITGVVTVDAAVVFHGKVTQRGSRSGGAPPPSTPPAGRRAAMQLLNTDLASSAEERTECAHMTCSSGGSSGSADLRNDRSMRPVLSMEELQAALRGASSHLAFTSDPAVLQASRDTAREGIEAVRRALQASSPSATSAAEAAAGAPSEVNLAAWLSVNRTRMTCSRDGVILLQAASNFVGVEFDGCQIIVGDTRGSTASIVNCVFRNTMDRPAIVIKPGGVVSIELSLFYNNSFVSAKDSAPGSLAVGGGSGSGTAAPSNSTALIGGELYWGAGSAVYVMPRGSLDYVASSAFVNNGNGAAFTRGGAIFLSGPGACLGDVINTAFQGNGRASFASQAGGAIYGEGVDGCDVAVSSTNFSRNAGGSGGAVYLTQAGSRAIKFTASLFWNNRALAAGGALYVSVASGRLYLYASQLVNNSAGERGGAVSLETVSWVSAEELRLEDNEAQMGVGGGLAHFRQGVLEVTRCTIARNTALYGGGLGCSQDLDVRLSDTSLVNNTARVHGGGLECYQCYNFTATRTNFTGNRALSGGGLVLTQVEQGGALTNVVLSDNTGMPYTSSETANIDQAACARDGRGGGGGICIDLRRSVALRGVTIANNTAVAGGGMFVTQRCLPGDTGCGPAVLTGCVFEGNVAQGGGGGAIFRSTCNLTNVTCPGDSDPTPWEQLQSACPRSWLRNTALYGSVTATIAYSLVLESPQHVPRYRSNDPLQLVVSVRDFHNQTILDASRESTTTLQVKPLANETDAVLLAGSSISTLHGVGNFTATLRLQAKPGTYPVTVTAPRTIQEVPPAEVLVTVRPCVHGEITNRDGTQCYPCELGAFSLNTSKTVCDRCPDNANCSLAGYPWVTMPQGGYWHSGPRSPNIMQCAYEDACRGRYDWPRQDNLAQYLIALDQHGTLSYNLTAYYELQCATGYHGNLCGRCDPGYGRSGAGKCTKCASRALNTLWYIFCSFINILFIVITVRAQLPGSLTSHRRIKQMNAARPVAASGTESTSTQAPIPARGPVFEGAGTVYGELTDRKGEPELLPMLSMSPSVADPLRPSQLQTLLGPPPTSEMPAPMLQAAAGGKDGAFTAKGDERGGDCAAAAAAAARSRRPSTASSAGSSTSSDSSCSDEIVKVDETAGPYKGGNHAVVFKILVSYLQVSSLIRKVTAPWPSALAFFLGLANTVTNSISTFVSIDCSLKHGGLPISVQRVIIAVATPLAILLLGLLLWSCLYLRLKLRRKGVSLSFASYFRPRVIITIIAIVFYVYPDLTVTLLSLFSCPVVDPEEGEYTDFMEAKGAYWAQDYNLKCYSGVHLILVAVLGGPGVLLLAIGAPIFSLVWLRTHHEKLYTSPEFGVAYGFMYEDYRRESYFWDSVIMLRKLAVVAVLVFLQPQGSAIQIMAALGVILLATAAQITIKPYKNASLNDLERLSLYALVAILYFAMLFLEDIPNSAIVALGWLLTLGNMAVIAYFVWRIIYEIGLYVIWTIDEHSNADGVLEWDDIWKYVEVKHSNRRYTTALVKFLRGLQAFTTFTRRAVSRPVSMFIRTGSWLRYNIRSNRRIKPEGADPQQHLDKQPPVEQPRKQQQQPTLIPSIAGFQAGGADGSAGAVIGLRQVPECAGEAALSPSPTGIRNNGSGVVHSGVEPMRVTPSTAAAPVPRAPSISDLESAYNSENDSDDGDVRSPGGDGAAAALSSAPTPIWVSPAGLSLPQSGAPLPRPTAATNTPSLAVFVKAPSLAHRPPVGGSSGGGAGTRASPAISAGQGRDSPSAQATGGPGPRPGPGALLQLRNAADS